MASRPNLTSFWKTPLLASGTFRLSCDFFILPQGQSVTLLGGPGYCRQTVTNDIGRDIVNVIFPLSAADTAPGVVFSKDLVPKNKYLIIDYEWYNYGSREAELKQVEPMVYVVLASFSRIIAGVHQKKVNVILGRKGNGNRIITATLSNVLGCNKRLLHGTLGLFRDIIEFSTKPKNIVYEDLLPSYPFDVVKKAIAQDDLPTIRNILLEALESLHLFRGSAYNSPCSTANIKKLKFIAENCNGPEMFITDTSLVRARLTVNPGSMYGANRLGSRYHGLKHIKIRYNILPNWTSKYYGALGWWESGNEKVFTKAKRKEYQQYLVAPKVEVAEEQSSTE